MSYRLAIHNGCLSVKLTADDAPGPVYVDFVRGASGYRRQSGGGKNQLIAKAVGIKSHPVTVLDVTAGLGRDAFVLACLGCHVVMCERSSAVFALLEDGLKRASVEAWFQPLSLRVVQADAIAYMAHVKAAPDVIYLDPMFPDRTKTALVKKEMRVLREVVGDDHDSADLLAVALKTAKKRVVVKRARLAPTLTDKKPDIVYAGKSSRFDVYLCGK